MIDQLLHFIGICPDGLSHFSVLNLLLFTPMFYLTSRIKALFKKGKKK